MLEVYIFTDADIAVVDDLGHIFREYPNFHLALTFHNYKAQPLKSGFIAVRGTAGGILRCVVTLSAYSELSMLFNTNSYVICFAVIVYQKTEMKCLFATVFYISHTANIAWVVTSHPWFDAKKFTPAQAFIEDIGGASVLFLPCAVCN